jgi:hypothetical protein
MVWKHRSAYENFDRSKVLSSMTCAYVWVHIVESFRKKVFLSLSDYVITFGSVLYFSMTHKSFPRDDSRKKFGYGVSHLPVFTLAFKFNFNA